MHYQVELVAQLLLSIKESLQELVSLRVVVLFAHHVEAHDQRRNLVLALYHDVAHFLAVLGAHELQRRDNQLDLEQGESGPQKVHHSVVNR